MKAGCGKWTLICSAQRMDGACSLTIASSKSKRSVAALGVFAKKTFQKSDDIGSYYGMQVSYNLSFKEHTRKLCASRVLKMDLVRFFKYALQTHVQ